MKYSILIICIISVVIFPTFMVFADSTNSSYSYTYWGRPVSSPRGVMATHSLNGQQLGAGSLSEPSDICVDKSGYIYIADSGNNRILILDGSLQLVDVLDKFTMDGKPSPLNNPQGIFVDKQGLIYIADTDNRRVVVCHLDGSIVCEFEKPHNEIEFSGIDFLPRKVISSSNGYVYVLCQGIYQGAVLYDFSGKFLGYYGTNRVEITPSMLFDYYWKQIMTNEQRTKVRRFVPEEYCNFDIDDKGFIYTVTEFTSNSLNQVKKLNTLGVNVLKSSNRIHPQYQGRYGDLELKWYEGRILRSRLVDISYDSGGFINVLDQERGRIFQYDTEGNLLFVAGGIGFQSGNFVKPVAITNMGSDILVLDAQKCNITHFALTEYGRLIREASTLYNDGLYLKARELWLEVFNRNGNCELAYAGIGKVYYEKGDYAKAMKYLKLGYDRINYGKAFKKYREECLRNILPIILSVVLLYFVVRFGYWLMKRANTDEIKEVPGKKNRIKISCNKKRMNVLIQPFKGYNNYIEKNYYPKWLIIMVLVLFFTGSVLERQLTGFLFNFNNLKDLNILYIFAKTVIAFWLWVAGNWAITTLFDGKGTLLQITFISAVALIPYVIASYLRILLSNLFIPEEAIFLNILFVVGVLHSCFLLFSGLMLIHNYTVQKVFWSSFFTILFIAVVLFLIIILFSLYQQTYNFFKDVFNELYYMIY